MMTKILSWVACACVLFLSANSIAYAASAAELLNRFNFLCSEDTHEVSYVELESLYSSLIELAKGSDTNSRLLKQHLERMRPRVREILLKDPKNLAFSDGTVYRRIVNNDELNKAAANRVLRLQEIEKLDVKEINVLELDNLIGDLEKLLEYRDEEGLLISSENALLLRNFLDRLSEKVVQVQLSVGSTENSGGSF
jgi:hypothetical protein